MNYRYAVNGSLLFQELPLLARPDAIAAAGFTAAEFWWPFAVAVPADAEVEAFCRAIEDSGLDLIGLNFFAGDMPAGDRGIVSWPGREAEFRDNVEIVVAMGERLGCRAFNALYGNRLAAVTPEQQDALALENLHLAASRVGSFGGQILLEAVSGAPAYPLKQAADVCAVLDRLAVGNAGFLCDLYHLSANGEDLNEVVEAYGDRVRHVQIADLPGRGEPGSGTLDLARHLAAITARGYDGYVALEYLPTGGTVESLTWLPVDERAVR